MQRLLLAVLLLAGCSAQEVQHALQVRIEASSETLEAFEPVTITANIQAGEPVNENADVAFELIHPSGNPMGTVKPTNNGDGTYSIETSFDATGTYRIIAHVDFEGAHDMPEVEVTVE